MIKSNGRGDEGMEKKIAKLIILDMSIAFVNIGLFSEGLLNIGLSNGPLQGAISVTAIVMSFIIFIVGNYRILTHREEVFKELPFRNEEDYLNALRQARTKKTFIKDLDGIIDQFLRFERKQQSIKDLLLQKFSETEMSYAKFDQGVLEIEQVFRLNIRSILNKMNAFDEIDYQKSRSANIHKKFNKDFVDAKLVVYQEYFDYIKGAIANNEEILLKLDRLILELSRFNSINLGELETLTAIREMDDLINKAKYYK